MSKIHTSKLSEGAALRAYAVRKKDTSSEEEEIATVSKANPGLIFFEGNLEEVDLLEATLTEFED